MQCVLGWQGMHAQSDLIRPHIEARRHTRDDSAESGRRFLQGTPPHRAPDPVGRTPGNAVAPVASLRHPERAPIGPSVHGSVRAEVKKGSPDGSVGRSGRLTAR